MYICLITGIAASGAACFEGSRLDFHKALKCAPLARPRPSPIAFQPREVGHGSAHRIELLALQRGVTRPPCSATVRAERFFDRVKETAALVPRPPFGFVLPK
jgi:hypothetical protein